MKILGLDVSSACTGYCIFEDGYLDLSSIGTIEPNQKDSIGKKLLYFEKQLKKLLKKHAPDEVVQEDIFRGPNIKTFKVLSMFRGISLKTIQEKLKKEAISLMPSEARRIVGAGITKEEAFAFAVNKYNLTGFVFEKDNDRTDAIILASSYFVPRPDEIKKIKRKKKSK